MKHQQILLGDGSIPTLFSPTTNVTRLINPRRSMGHKGAADSDIGARKSVPPSQDPLSFTGQLNHAQSNYTLEYFGRFTSGAKTAADRHKKDVLDELLVHQDDPMYFHNTHSDASPPPSPPLVSILDDALAEALASDIYIPKLARMDYVESTFPMPISSSHKPGKSSPSSSTSSPVSTRSSQSPRATFSRMSSSIVSFLPSGSPRSSGTVLTHGSPFASSPYIPPTGAPGFAGDRAWDRGFSDTLDREEIFGFVDSTGLGTAAGTGTEMTTSRHANPKGITLSGRWQGTARVLTEEIADLIRPHLPALTQLPRHWTLLYALDQHGISLNTLYARCEPRVPSRADPDPPKGGLLAIQDAHDAIFGVWLSEGIRVEKGGYYGSGESFLWRYHPPTDGGRQGRLDVYAWTGANTYVTLCEPRFISFGGGDGHYGLYVGASLLEGSSAPCPTFGNPPLCAGAPRMGELNGVVKARADEQFECVGLEVWGIVPG